jgi:hypothetical protein
MANVTNFEKKELATLAKRFKLLAEREARVCRCFRSRVCVGVFAPVCVGGDERMTYDDDAHIVEVTTHCLTC